VSPLQSFGFSALQVDQFGAALTQPLDTQWTVSGGGSIDVAGTFTAREASGGPFVVSASASGLRSTAQVSIGPGGIAAIPPAVSIVGPYTGERVRGMLRLTLDASSSAGVSNIELLVDGTRVALLTAAPWALDLDTVQFSDGEHALDAVVTDSAGNVAHAETVRLFFRNSQAEAEAVVGQIDFGCSSTDGSFLFTLMALLPFLRLRKGARRSSSP
jgi:hypothetical protein